MADKPEKKPEAAAPAGDKKEKEHAKGGIGALLGKMPVLIGIVMVLEAAVLFAGFKFLGGGPKAAAGAELTETGGDAHGKGDGHGGGAGGKDGKAKDGKKKSVEVPVLELRAPNKITGRTLLFDVTIVIRVKGDHEETVKQKITDNKGLITDRIRTIMAQSDPEKLGGGSEPGLETFRRQVKYQLDDVLGEATVEEVLVPRCIPFRADF